jgi:hypothetical protein
MLLATKRPFRSQEASPKFIQSAADGANAFEASRTSSCQDPLRDRLPLHKLTRLPASQTLDSMKENLFRTFFFEATYKTSP